MRGAEGVGRSLDMAANGIGEKGKKELERDVVVVVLNWGAYPGLISMNRHLIHHIVMVNEEW